MAVSVILHLQHCMVPVAMLATGIAGYLYSRRWRMPKLHKITDKDFMRINRLVLAIAVISIVLICSASIFLLVNLWYPCR